MGIEPTWGFFSPHDGFEGRRVHQEPFRSHLPGIYSCARRPSRRTAGQNLAFSAMETAAETDCGRAISPTFSGAAKAS